MSRLLEGVRVLESAMLFNGDSLGMLLGDLGADVIKVESPFLGDYLRDFLGQVTPHHSPAHLQVNKNKRSITLDLRTDAGREAFFELLRTADVFVDGNAGDACDRLGIGYTAQRAVKPDIVYCQYSGFGATGPYASVPTHGQMMNALAGALPQADGDDGLVVADTRPRLINGIPSAGEGTAAGAVHAAFHVAAALFRRDRTGEGCLLDAAGSDAVLAAAWIGATYELNEHRIADRSTLPASADKAAEGAKYQFYRTRDKKYVLFCAIEPKFWRNFCRVVGREDLMEAHDDGPVDFGAGQLSLRRELQALFEQRDLSEWMDVAVGHDIPIGPAYEAADLRDDPHLQTRQILVEGHHPHAGPFTYIGEPVIVDGQPYEVRRPAPLLGEQTDEILAEIGYDAERIARLRADKVV